MWKLGIIISFMYKLSDDYYYAKHCTCLFRHSFFRNSQSFHISEQVEDAFFLLYTMTLFRPYPVSYFHILDYSHYIFCIVSHRPIEFFKLGRYKCQSVWSHYWVLIIIKFSVTNTNHKVSPKTKTRLHYIWNIYWFVCLGRERLFSANTSAISYLDNEVFPTLLYLLLKCASSFRFVCFETRYLWFIFKRVKLFSSNFLGNCCANIQKYK